MIETTLKLGLFKGRPRRLTRVTLLNRTLYRVYHYTEGEWALGLETCVYGKAICTLYSLGA